MKEKLIQEIKDQIWKLNYEIAFAEHVMPQAETLKAAAQKEADDLKAQLEVFAQNNDQKKKAVREELKKLSHAFGQAMQKVGNYAAVITGKQEEIKQHKEKIAGYENRLAFLEQYQG